MILLGFLALLVWVYLLAGHGRFWQAGPFLAETPVIAASLRSLLAQDYPGRLEIVLVDDCSTDGTGDIARGFADPRLRVLTGRQKPPGWSGKLWAVSQGIAAGSGEVFLLTDADIEHQAGHLSALVAKAESEKLDLVSEMVALNCASFAERALVPAGPGRSRRAPICTTLRRFGRSPLWAPFLPVVAVFYMAATIGSALDHANGRGVVWKHRAYTEKQA